MRFIIDCDGVLANFTKRVLTLAGSKMSEADVVSYDIFGLLNSEREGLGDEARKECSSPSFWAGIEPYDGVGAALNRIRRTGATVVVASSPWVSCPEWESVRREWLYDRCGVFSKEFVSIPSDLKHVLRGSVFVEDRRDILIRCGAHASNFLVSRPYNAAPAGDDQFDSAYRRVASVVDVADWADSEG